MKEPPTNQPMPLIRPTDINIIKEIKGDEIIWSRLHDRWGDRRVARSARPGNPLSRDQILPCKRSRWGNPPSRGPIRDTSNSRKIHFGGGFASLLKVTIESHSTEGCSKSNKGV